MPRLKRHIISGQIAAFWLMLCGACSQVVTPDAEDRPNLTITLGVDRSSVSPGDTVRFRVVAHNSSDEAIQVGIQCGPTMDVRLATPAAEKISVLQAMYEPNGAVFTCELGPYHFAQPHDSLTERLVWRAPEVAGSYAAIAGARGRSGLQDLSGAIWITVR